MKEWKTDELESYLENLYTNKGFAIGNLLRDQVLDDLVSYEYVKSALATPQGVSLFKGVVDRITQNIDYIIKKCKAGKTKATVETIIPHAQEINIMIDMLNEWSRILTDGNGHVGEIKKKRSN